MAKHGDANGLSAIGQLMDESIGANPAHSTI